MSLTRVKICGVMRMEDALIAAQHGADAIGFVLYECAKRCVTPQRARRIISALPPFVTPVGLFVDESPQKILDIASELNLNHVQLHGDESPEEIAELSGLQIIKAIRVKAETISAELSRWRTMIGKLGITNIAGFVLETGGTADAGGTGVENDWPMVQQLQSRGEFDGLPKIIAAGGLTPENVGQVVRDIRPWAVDVSSGVESTFGEKSPQKIEKFIRAVEEADHSAVAGR